MENLFSVAAMFILFRETLEAAIIISVMLQLCAKMQLDKLKKWGAFLLVNRPLFIFFHMS